MSCLNYNFHSEEDGHNVIRLLTFLHLYSWCCNIWALPRENLSSGFANHKGADQPAHMRSLISAFVIRFMESTISRIATNEISII